MVVLKQIALFANKIGVSNVLQLHALVIQPLHPKKTFIVNLAVNKIVELIYIINCMPIRVVYVKKANTARFVYPKKQTKKNKMNIKN